MHVASEQLSSIFAQEYPVLCRIAGRIVGADHAEDVVQDACVRLLRSNASMSLELVHCTVKHTAIDLWRHHNRTRVSFVPIWEALEYPDEYQVIEQREEIRSVLDSLPPEQRRVMAAVADDHSPTEIAALYGKRVHGVNCMVNRARRTLREKRGA